MELFAIATRKNYGFTSVQGTLSVTDLWQLPLKSGRQGRADLENVAQEAYKELQASQATSFVDEASAGSVDAQNKLDVVKFIIATKKAEAVAQVAARAAESQKAKIQDIIASKKDESLKNMSIEELEALIK